MARPLKDKVLAMAREYLKLTSDEQLRFNSLVNFGNELLAGRRLPLESEKPKRGRPAKKQAEPTEVQT